MEKVAKVNIGLVIKVLRTTVLPNHRDRPGAFNNKVDMTCVKFKMRWEIICIISKKLRVIFIIICSVVGGSINSINQRYWTSLSFRIGHVVFRIPSFNASWKICEGSQVFSAHSFSGVIVALYMASCTLSWCGNPYQSPEFPTKVSETFASVLESISWEHIPQLKIPVLPANHLMPRFTQHRGRNVGVHHW